MWKNEWYKILCKKKIWVIFLVCLVLKCIFSTQMETVMFQDYNGTVYRHYIEKVEGPYTPEKHQWLISELEKYQERVKNKTFYEEQYQTDAISAEEFSVISDEIKSAKNRIPNLNYLLEKSEYLKNLGDEAEYFYDIAVMDYVEHMDIDLFMLLVLIIVITLIFTEDYTSGTVLLVKSSANGKGKLFYCRFGCAVLCSAVCGVVFPIAEFIVKYIAFDLGNLQADVKNLMIMESCNLSMSIGQYIILTVVIRMLYAIVFGMLVMLLAQVTHQNVATYIVALGLVYLPEFLYPHLGTYGQLFSLGRGLGAYRVFVPYSEVFGIPGTLVSGLFWCLLTVGIVGVSGWSFVRKM